MKLFSKSILSLQIAALAVCLAAGASAYAQETSKIGFVNTDRIFKEAAPAKAAPVKAAPVKAASTGQSSAEAADPLGNDLEIPASLRAAAGPTREHDQLPLPDFDHMTLGSLRGRLRRLDDVSLVQLLDYEESHAKRLPIVSMLQNRLRRAIEEGQAAGGAPQGAPADVPSASPAPSSAVTPGSTNNGPVSSDSDSRPGS